MDFQRGVTLIRDDLELIPVINDLSIKRQDSVPVGDYKDVVWFVPAHVEYSIFYLCIFMPLSLTIAGILPFFTRTSSCEVGHHLDLFLFFLVLLACSTFAERRFLQNPNSPIRRNRIWNGKMKFYMFQDALSLCESLTNSCVVAVMLDTELTIGIIALVLLVIYNLPRFIALGIVIKLYLNPANAPRQRDIVFYVAKVFERRVVASLVEMMDLNLDEYCDRVSGLWKMVVQHIFFRVTVIVWLASSDSCPFWAAYLDLTLCVASFVFIDVNAFIQHVKGQMEFNKLKTAVRELIDKEEVIFSSRISLRRYGRYIQNIIHESHNIKKVSFALAKCEPYDFHYWLSVFLTSPSLNSLDVSKQGDQVRNILRWEIADFINLSTSLVELNLANNRLGDYGLAEILTAIEYNHTIRTLNLGGNRITIRGAEKIKLTFMYNSTLKELNLELNSLRTPGIEIICEMLKLNRSIININLGFNNVDPEALTLVCDLLLSDSCLEEISLTGNSFGKIGVSELNRVFERNQTLRAIDLRWNYLEEDGCARLCQGLAKNSLLHELGLKHNNIGIEGLNQLCRTMLLPSCYIQKLSVGKNNLGDAGAKILRNLIINSRRLLELDVSANELTDRGIKFICRGLRQNVTMKVLDLSANQFSHKGVKEIVKLILLNKDMEKIDLGNNRFGRDDCNLLKKALQFNSKLQLKNFEKYTISDYVKLNNVGLK